jgi:hypothetical protein
MSDHDPSVLPDKPQQGLTPIATFIEGKRFFEGENRSESA